MIYVIGYFTIAVLMVVPAALAIADAMEDGFPGTELDSGEYFLASFLGLIASLIWPVAIVVMATFMAVKKAKTKGATK